METPLVQGDHVTSLLIMTGIALYVLGQLAIGVWVSGFIKTEDDYLLAGRSLGYTLATFSIYATWFGSETCIGTAGKIFGGGLSAGNADPFGFAVGLFLAAVLFAVPLWKRGLTTLADLFRVRYSQSVERIVVVILVPTSIMWAAAQIRALGEILVSAANLGWNPRVELECAIILATAVIMIYTASGGLMADAWTDFIQGLALMIGLAILTIMIFVHFGGPIAAYSHVTWERANLFGGNESFWVQLDGWAIPICGCVVAQELVSRMMAARSPQVAQRSGMVAAGLYLLVGLMPVTAGLLGPTLLPDLDPEFGDRVLPMLAQRHLPLFLYILFIGALVSAILSTVDTALLVSSSLVSHNLILSVWPKLSETAKVRVARVGVVVAGVLAYLIARQAERVYDLVVSASELGASATFVIVVMGLFTRIGGPAAALASVFAGTAVYIYGTFVYDTEFHPKVAGQESLWDVTFLLSLAAGLGAYFTIALVEWLLGRGPAANTTPTSPAAPESAGPNATEAPPGEAF